ncbi:Transposase Tc1-like [Trinorchestia longiramus]|nr:Transposase Tc1-like [Trinorchestia longiramus]
MKLISIYFIDRVYTEKDSGFQKLGARQSTVVADFLPASTASLSLSLYYEVPWPDSTKTRLQHHICEIALDDLKASGIEASKHSISRALCREGLGSRTPHRTLLLQTRYVKARLKYANDH